VILAGGGTNNPSLVAMLTERLVPSQVTTHQVLGISDDAKEAITMAMLAHEAIHGRTGNLPACTGAGKQAVLGKITPGANYKELLRNVMRG
jgi:anhydro-N-acetylmuramic acid kinase